MLRRILRAGVLAFTGCLAYGQLTFEVASVKPAAPLVPDSRGRIMMMAPSGGPGTKDPGRIRYPNMSLRALLMSAYDVKSFQITGPAFLDMERFDLNATLPPDSTKEQFRTMMQNLLAERFQLKVHHETKDLPMYSMVVAKNGPKMKESAEEPAAKEGDADVPPPPLPSAPKIGPDGFPVLPAMPGGRGGMFMMMMPGRARLSGQRQTMLDLANRLTNQLGRPVTDATGLTGKYDITLTFSPEGMNGPMGMMPPPPPPPGGGAGPGGPGGAFVPEGEAPQDIFAAMQSQLGLKLEAKKGAVDTIVVDHMEKTPTEKSARCDPEPESGSSHPPLRPGLPERQTHDYKRHGTTTLFAAFNILNGKVIGTCQERHRSREFIRFLNHLEREIPAGQDVHLIMDNYCTHKSEEVQRWLKPRKRKRFHFPFTPTSSSWLNQVERFFAMITGRMIRRGTFHSTDELEAAIYKWLATWNGKPTPFVWKASADVILDKVRRCKELSETGD